MLIDIRPDHLQIVQEILQRHVPQYAVWAFGSRAKWTAKDYSDLDLCVVSDKALDFRVLGALTEDFSESDLPYKVDVVDWATTSESFRKIIEQDKVVIQKEQQTQISHVGRVSPSGVTRQAADAPANEDVGLCDANPTYVADWQVLLLSELTINHDTKRKPVKGPDRKPGPYPYYGASGIVDYVDGYLFDGDYLLIAEDGENLRTRQTPIAFMANGRFWVNNHAHIVTGNERANTRFLMYALLNADVHSFLTGAVMPKLTQGNLNNIPIACPPREIQDAIVGVLGALDDRIALLRETNATLEAIAQALFKSWFVDFDSVRAKQQGLEPEGMDAETAAFFPDSFEESELGLVPSGWQVGKVEQLLELAYGKALKASDRIAGATPVYGSGGVTGYHNEALVNVPSIVIGRKGTVGSLYWEDRPFFPIDTVFYVKTKEPLTYCFYQLQRLGLEGMNTDGAVPGLNRNNVYRLPIVLPLHEILMAFDEIVSPVRQKIFANSEQAQTLATLRDTLLPRLISGQLRLPDTKVLIEETV
ncbi:MAG: restriction endonuclease subunit S [Methylobacter sp.]|jgi:type I restriction enzyme S subunit|nr:restriction endonuclease subunit S [Methylobacter sp.]